MTETAVGDEVSQQREPEEPEEYEHIQENVSRDPFNRKHIFYRAAVKAGFPVSLVEGATDHKGKSQPDKLCVRVRDVENADILDEVDSGIQRDIRTILIRLIDEGYSRDFVAPLEGHGRAIRYGVLDHLHPYFVAPEPWRTESDFSNDIPPYPYYREGDRKFVKTGGIQLDKDFLARCFIRAEQRRVEHMKAQGKKETNGMWSKGLRVLREELEQQGVKPVDTEDLSRFQETAIKDFQDYYPPVKVYQPRVIPPHIPDPKYI